MRSNFRIPPVLAALAALAVASGQAVNTPVLAETSAASTPDTVRRVEALISASLPHLRPLPLRPNARRLRNANLEGTWASNLPLARSWFRVRAEPDGRYAVEFSTGDCMASWHLRRHAVWVEGVLQLDRPVCDIAGQVCGRFFVVVGKKHPRLIPAEWDGRDELTCFLAQQQESGRRKLPGLYERMSRKSARNLHPERSKGVPAPGHWVRAADPRKLMPQHHWAYDAMTVIAQDGLWLGVPDNTFGGKAALPRSRFAESLESAAAAIGLYREVGGRRYTRAHTVPAFIRLCHEFLPELRSRGVPTSLLVSAVVELESYAKAPHPQGLSYPRPSTPWSWPIDTGKHPDAAQQGAMEAADAWAAGKVALYTLTTLPPEKRGFPLAIPMVQIPEGPGAVERLIGHNQEVWRRLRKHGPPPGANLEWTPALFDLKTTWRRSPRERRGKLEAGGVAAPEGDLKARWRYSAHQSRLMIGTPGAEVEIYLSPQHFLGVHDLRRPEILWGPPGSGVAYLRGKIGGKPRIYAFDVRSGWLLNAGPG